MSTCIEYTNLSICPTLDEHFLRFWWPCVDHYTLSTNTFFLMISDWKSSTPFKLEFRTGIFFILLKCMCRGEQSFQHTLSISMVTNPFEIYQQFCKGLKAFFGRSMDKCLLKISKSLLKDVGKLTTIEEFEKLLNL